MPSPNRIVTYVLTVVLPATLVCGIIYGVAQQIVRSAANDPQIQLAEDAASQLADTALPEALIGDQTVDASKSLAPFIIIYDSEGKYVAGDATFGGKDPVVSAGVLDYAKLHGQNRVTWQTASGLRFAAVVVRSGGDFDGYVVSARSLREVEVRESQLLNIVVAGWLVLLVAGAVAFGWITRPHRHQKTA